MCRTADEVCVVQIWKSASEVVFKDLPRLAKRITVEQVPNLEVSNNGCMHVEGYTN